VLDPDEVFRLGKRDRLGRRAGKKKRRHDGLPTLTSRLRQG
jgi:hypothetical protein